MRDKRPVDELSVEELERILAIRRREDRQRRLERMKATGRIVETPNGKQTPPPVTLQQETAPEVMAIPAATITLDALDAILERKEAPPKFDDSLAVVSTIRDDDAEQVSPEVKQSASKGFINFILLLVEVAAVVGLIFLGFALYTQMVGLQKESAEAQRLASEQLRASIPTLAPTSVIQVAKLEDFVLPGGHVIDSEGNASFNFGEFIDDVPSSLRQQVVYQALALDLTRPPITSETALQVFIPKLNVDAPIVQGSDWEALKQSVGQVQNGATPTDANGNVVLAAHNDIYGALFKDIPELVEGDLIQVQTATQIFNYRVTATEKVDPNDVHVLENRDKSIVTLITCYPPGVNNKRYIVYAERENI